MNEIVEKSEFLSSVSHEIRTELNTIAGLSEDIYGYEDIPEEIREDAEDLITSSRSLLELLDNVLDFVAIEKDRMKIVNAPYNPKELFEKIAKKDEKFIEDKPVYLHTSIDQNIPFELIGDRKNIVKILNNLLINAIKFTDGGDIWFNVDCINTKDDCTLNISVRDTGRGMKPEEKDDLFNRMEHLDIRIDSYTDKVSLGLTIAKCLVDMMGGNLKIESVYGEGTEIIVTIPQKIKSLVESELSRTQRLKLEEINYEEEGYGYKKILIVDDNELNIKVVRRILEQYDLLIEECSNGEECIDLVSETNDYDLILMDIMMPGMNGEETLNKLKQIEDFKTPVVALTANAESGLEEQYENEGFAGYISKPFSKNQIEEKLNMIFKTEDLREEE